MVLDAKIDEAAFRECDLLAFEIAIETGHPGSVMCAYNRVGGTYACENPLLLTDVLRTDWKYPGWVMSDWGAIPRWQPRSRAWTRRAATRSTQVSGGRGVHRAAQGGQRGRKVPGAPVGDGAPHLRRCSPSGSRVDGNPMSTGGHNEIPWTPPGRGSCS